MRKLLWVALGIVAFTLTPVLAGEAYRENPDHFPSLTFLVTTEDGSADIDIVDGSIQLDSQDFDGVSTTLSVGYVHPLSASVTFIAGISLTQYEQTVDTSTFFFGNEVDGDVFRASAGVRVYFRGGKSLD